MLSSKRQFLSLLFAICIIGLNTNCRHKVKLEDLMPIVNEYYKNKYQNLGNPKIMPMQDVSSELVGKLQTKEKAFVQSLKGYNMDVINLECQPTVDSFNTNSGKANFIVREELNLKYVIKGQDRSDTVASQYISYFNLNLEKKDNAWSVSSETVMYDDPLSPLAKPQFVIKTFDSSVFASVTPTATFDRVKTVQYAFDHFDKPNPAYCNYEDGERGDCTNFASQCLSEGGGWFMSGEWRAEGKSCCSNLIACDIENCYTCTWTVAQNFYDWLPKSNRVEPQSSDYSRLDRGDILQQDWDKDGRIDHTMIVTESQGGVLFVTYRSAKTGSARRNAPVAQIRGNLIGFKVKDEF